MRSSTFNSEPRKVPSGRWSATWLVTALLAVTLIWQIERVTRAHGQRPNVTDEPVWWSLSRRSVDGDPHVVAFVGSSRMALGYSPQAFREAAPDLRAVQLALNGSPAFGVLEDLANDPEFRGIAVVDIIEWDVGVFDGFTSSRPFVERSHALWRAPGALANKYLASFAEERLAVLAIGGRHFVQSAVTLRWPKPSWAVADRDRTMRGDYSLADPKELQRKREWRIVDFFTAIPTPEAWLATLDRDIEPFVQRIRAHGGDVVVVHMPISGVFAQHIDTGYPRARFWDAFAARSSAHVIHFRDLAALANLECPDEMHLDQRDQAIFTRSLVEAMRARGVFRGRE